MTHFLVSVVFSAFATAVLAAPPNTYPTVLVPADSKSAKVSLEVAASGETESRSLLETAPSPAIFPYRQTVNGSTPTGNIALGTPAKNVYMIFDTGSDVLLAKTWSTIEQEVYAVDAGISGMVRPSAKLYDSNSSATYEVAFDKKGKRAKGFIQYGSGMAATIEGRDTVRVGLDYVISNFSISEIAQDTLSMLHDATGTAGVLGLQHMKNNSYGSSLFTRAREMGLMSAVGYCCNSDMKGGTFIWGDDSTEGVAVPVSGQIHWAVPLSSVALIGGNANLTASSISEATDGTKSKKTIVAAEEEPLSADIRPKGLPVDSAIEAEDVEETILIEGQGWGLIETVKKVHGKQLPAAPVSKNPTPVVWPVCPEGKCAVVIDTGSNIIAMPQNTLSALNKLLKVKPDCSNVGELPSINLNLGSVNVTIPPESYIMKVVMPDYGDLGYGLDGEESETEEIAEIRERGLKSVGPHASLVEDHDISLESLDSEAAVMARVDRMLKDIKSKYHLDIKEALKYVENPMDSIMNTSTFCMTAFVALDAETSAGQLWILGTPLFNQYYTRWSWATGDESPKMFFSPIAESTTCNPAAKKVATQSAGNTMVVLEESKAKLIRSEGKEDKTAKKAAGKTMQIREVRPHEIRYPSWAVGIKEV